MTTEQSKPNILLVYGGESPEHEVSIASATNVYNALDASRYTALLCYIDQDGGFWHTETIEPQTAHRLVPVLGASTVEYDGQTHHIEAIFAVLHGQNGEDGTIQGLARLMHTPIVGCGVTASSICIDKVLAKQLLDYNHIPIVPFIVGYKGDAYPTYKQTAATLGETLFVKPARLGSSVGVSKVTDQAGLLTALDAAFALDDKVLIEAGITARELEVAVLGHNAQPKASAVGEIIPDREFYSFASKYDANATSQVKIPADIPNETAEQIRTYAVQAFTALQCEGLSRVDFFIDPAGKVYLNEINTLPGFTDISMYPQLWQHEGIGYTDLLTRLIELARKQ
jgi:D-alanine-D-alanine ligase